MFLYVFEVNNENEELAWKVFRRFCNNPDLWQKARKFCSVLVESNKDGKTKEMIDDIDFNTIKNTLLLISAIIKEDD